MQEADPIEAYRLQANLKSIHRSDTAVQAILSSSNYATIYHYEQEAGPTGEGEWVKQKAEGPLFVVKRNTSPEHAIFMLNRQTVKNVTIPLVPGEMKVTAVGAGMLQIARRGEKVRRGVWFSEGEPMVEKFRQTILSMCGEPSARPAAVPNHSQNGMTSSPIQQDRVPAVMASAPSPNAASGAVGGDGLSRLFAGLMPTGPSISNPAPAPVSSAATNPPAAAPAQMPHTHDTAQSHPVKGHHPTPTAQPKSPSPVPPASHPVQRPGETVDDLLNSILGVGGAGGGGIKPPHPFSPPPVQHQPNPTANAQAPPDRSMTPSHTHPDPPAALHVGTASPFPSLPQPPTQSGQGGNHRSNSPFAHPAQMGSPGPAIMQSPLRREQRPNGDMPPNGIPFPGPPAPPQHVNGVSPDPGLVAREAVVDVLQRAMPDMRQGGKDALARTVAGLIANEPRFVDDLWESYVRRLNGAPG